MSVNWYYTARSWEILNYDKRNLFDFLIPLAYLYWKWLIIITSKSLTHFSKKKTVCFIYRDSSRRMMILLSRCYTVRGGTTMNYAKKVVIFFYHGYFFHMEYLIRQEGSTKYMLYVLSFSLYLDTTLKLKV